MKVAEMTKMFLDSRRRGTDGARKRCSAATVAIYRRNLELFERFLLEEVPSGAIVDYENIRRGTVLALIDWTETKQASGDWSPATILQLFRCLRSFFKWVEKDEDCQAENLKSLNKYLPALGNTPRKEYIPMTKDLKEFRNAYDTHKNYSFRNYVIFTLLLDTGIRVGELCNLRLDDLQLAEGIIIVDGKTGRRVVPVTEACARLLKAWLKRRTDTTMGKTSQHVFISKYQERLSENGVGQMFRKMRKTHGLGKITPHTLRHSFASYSLRNGAGIETVRHVLGHTSLTTTGKYLHMAKMAGKEMKAELERVSVLNDI